MGREGLGISHPTALSRVCWAQGWDRRGPPASPSTTFMSACDMPGGGRVEDQAEGTCHLHPTLPALPAAGSLAHCSIPWLQQTLPKTPSPELFPFCRTSRPTLQACHRTRVRVTSSAP